LNNETNTYNHNVETQTERDNRKVEGQHRNGAQSDKKKLRKRLSQVIFIVVPIILLSIYALMFTMESPDLIALQSFYLVLVLIPLGMLSIGILDILGFTKSYGYKLKTYDGTITRAVKAPGHRNEAFITGDPEDILKDLLLEDWPFPGIDKDVYWRAFDGKGTDVTEKPIQSFEGQVYLVFEEKES
jgi:hypothetical protein